MSGKFNKKYVANPFNAIKAPKQSPEDAYQIHMWNFATAGLLKWYLSTEPGISRAQGNAQLEALRKSAKQLPYEVCSRIHEGGGKWKIDNLMDTETYRDIVAFRYVQQEADPHSFFWIGRIPREDPNHVAPLYILSDAQMYDVLTTYVAHTTVRAWRLGMFNRQSPTFDSHFVSGFPSEELLPQLFDYLREDLTVTEDDALHFAVHGAWAK